MSTVVLDTADSSFSSRRRCHYSPVRYSTSPRRYFPVCAGHLEDSGTMRLDPWVRARWCRWWGVRGALRASRDAKAAGEPSEPGGEANAGLECSALHRGGVNSAAHLCGSQVDGRGVLRGGTEWVLPRGAAPASALSCWSTRGGKIGPHVRTGERTDRGGGRSKSRSLTSGRLLAPGWLYLKSKQLTVSCKSRCVIEGRMTRYLRAEWVITPGGWGGSVYEEGRQKDSKPVNNPYDNINMAL